MSLLSFGRRSTIGSSTLRSTGLAPALVAGMLLAAPAALGAEDPESPEPRINVAYDVSDLVDPDSAAPEATAQTKRKPLAALADLLSRCIAQTSWSDVGGPGTIMARKSGKPCLYVSQTADIHAQIAELLQALRSDAAESPPRRDNPKLAAALEYRLSLDFHDKPWAEAMRALVDALPAEKRVSITLPSHDPAAKAAGHGFDDDDLDRLAGNPVTFRAANIRLRSALRLILRPYEMYWWPADGAIQIITDGSDPECSPISVVRVYDVSDLVRPADRPADLSSQLNDLRRAIMEVVGPPWVWQPVGGEGEIEFHVHKRAVKMIASNSEFVQERVRNLLSELRATPYKPVGSPAGDGVMTRAIRDRYDAALRAQVSADFEAKPLAAALEELTGQAPEAQRVSIYISGVAQSETQCADAPVTLRGYRGSLEDAIAKCLHPLRLGVERSCDVLKVDYEEMTAQSLETRVYDVTQATAADDPREAKARLDGLLAAAHSVAPEKDWVETMASAVALNLNRRWLIVAQTPRMHAAIASRLAAGSRPAASAERR